MADHGFPLSRTVIKSLAFQVLKESQRDTLVNLEKGLSDNWWSRFRARHPELSTRTPDSLARSRVRGATPEALAYFFSLYENLVVKLTPHASSAELQESASLANETSSPAGPADSAPSVASSTTVASSAACPAADISSTPAGSPVTPQPVRPSTPTTPCPSCKRSDVSTIHLVRTGLIPQSLANVLVSPSFKHSKVRRRLPFPAKVVTSDEYQEILEKLDAEKAKEEQKKRRKEGEKKARKEQRAKWDNPATAAD
ncbi:hypothetical protein SKAU_G00123070 [Synaphobranchus kaupii]|uniref:HTH CENPB-type domain-containing protein n=1 Tax=Synaphobranchus kaupii TaxID=118154 RepID=A0A9Q1FNW9_SYNKA|nr:hypothetical protein SKAU_G00123070 [Synaphobranchus kaupii]